MNFIPNTNLPGNRPRNVQFLLRPFRGGQLDYPEGLPPPARIYNLGLKMQYSLNYPHIIFHKGETGHVVKRGLDW
jgi:hypothetical protein